MLSQVKNSYSFVWNYMLYILYMIVISLIEIFISCMPFYEWKEFFLISDGPYFITVRAINKVEYGGPLATSFCHSTPYIVDNTPPFVYEIYNIRYEEDQFNLSMAHNSSYVFCGVV